MSRTHRKKRYRPWNWQEKSFRKRFYKQFRKTTKLLIRNRRDDEHHPFRGTR